MACTAEHLRVEFCAGMEEVRAVIDEVPFEVGAFVPQMS